MTACTAVVEDNDNAQNRVEELARGIRELGEDEREGLLDLLLEKGF